MPASGISPSYKSISQLIVWRGGSSGGSEVVEGMVLVGARLSVGRVFCCGLGLLVVGGVFVMGCGVNFVCGLGVGWAYWGCA